jgi:hypothetical protein
MDTLVEVCNEEIHLHDASLLQSATILATCSSAGHSSSARLATPMPLASPLVVSPAARGGLHCDHYGRDGHVEAFIYRKKKDHARRSSQGTGFGGSERSSAGLETQEILMLLPRLAASTSSGVAGSVTQPSAPTGSATASQSFALRPSSLIL